MRWSGKEEVEAGTEKERMDRRRGTWMPGRVPGQGMCHRCAPKHPDRECAEWTHTHTHTCKSSTSSH